MASNSGGPPSDFLENVRPSRAQTTAPERHTPRINNLSSTEHSSRTSSSTARTADENPLSLILPRDTREYTPTVERRTPRVHENHTRRMDSDHMHIPASSTVRTTTEYPLNLIAPTTSSRSSTSRTTNISTINRSESESLNDTNFRARNIDRARLSRDRLEPYNLNAPRDRRHTPRVHFSEDLDETPSDSHPTVDAYYNSYIRRISEGRGMIPERDYTPTRHDPSLAVTTRNYTNTSNPSQGVAPRRYRPFPLTTSTTFMDLPDLDRVYSNSRRQTPLPRPTATSSVNISNSIPVSTPNVEQAQTTPEVPDTPTAAGTDECPICISPFVAPLNAILVHPCRHEFCLECIQTWIRTQRQRLHAQSVNCPFCRGPINRIVDRDGNNVEYQINNVPTARTERLVRWRRSIIDALANGTDPTPRVSRTMGGVDAFDEFRRTLNRVGPAGNISEQIARVRERLDDADANSSRPANANDLPNGALGWWT
ncbi:hypothetical protein BOTCAL_0089g00290 [Botryotinia calthae]|uniref:RING-type domain-containing protein n=1 Tax=Botryotinia calthae TaxID=38488 RepID=A0A4Y8D7L4_9HELO|nr:hypothetical protein BOTCAL_0089g00290 [Botryotinia calthae]